MRHDETPSPNDDRNTESSGSTRAADSITRLDGVKKALAALNEDLSGQIGPYKLLSKIGEGGFGMVYLAEQVEPVRRRVALKVIKPGMDSKQVITRFGQELQALAVMDHPNIARVLDAGSTDRGLPYFVMEHIKGEPITAYCDRQNLTIRDRLSVFITVCDAVQHAHMKGVIHRDIKPSNILVAAGDKGPMVKVIDFGVAKALAQNTAQGTIFTEQGQLIGTPEYMSPEQAEMGATDIDTRTDVYSLGVLLYELLTGATPFDSKTLRAAGLSAIQQIIREKDPPKPSTRLSSLGAAGADILRHRQTSAEILARELSSELDWIPLKAMRKDRTDRYRTPSDLADDVRNYLDGRPLDAGPESATYRLRKYARRHRASITAAATIVFLLIGGIAGTTTFALRSAANERRARDEARRADEEATLALAARDEQTRAREDADRQRNRAETERDRAERVTQFVTRALTSSDPNKGGEQGLLVTDAMDQAVKLLDAGELKDQPETEASLRMTISSILNGNGRPTEALRNAEAGLAISERLHRGDHADVVVGLSNVATSLYRLDRMEEALRKHEASAEMSLRLFKGDHECTASALNSVAACLAALGRSSEALPKYEAALEMRRRLFKGDHPDLAMSLNNVGYCHLASGQFDRAMSRFDEALAMHQRLHAGDHPSVATSLNNVAGCLKAQGKIDEALERYESALAMWQRMFKGDHPDVAMGLNNIASSLLALGRSEEALSRYQAALDMRQRLYKGDHSDIAMSLNNVASCLLARGKTTEALPQYEAALEMFQRLFPGDHPDVATSLNNVAFCLHSMGQANKALPKFEASLAMRTRLFSGDHPDIAKGLSNLASCLEALDRSADALPRYEAALDMVKRIYTGDHCDVALAINNLAYCLDNLTRLDEALPHYQAALEMEQRIHTGDHSDVAASLNNVAVCLRAMKRFDEALPKYDAAIAMFGRVLPENHPDVLYPQIGKARTLMALKRFDEAERLLLYAADQCEKSPSVRARQWASVKSNLIQLYEAWQTIAPDKGYAEKAAEWKARD